MPFTFPTPAQRIDATLAQNAPLDRVCDLIADYRDADLRFARTQSDADYIDTMRLQDEVLEVIGDAFGVNLDEQRAGIAELLLAECGYSIKEGCYVPTGKAA